MAPSSTFERAYARGVVTERRVDAVAAEAGVPYVWAEGFALRGCVVTPDERIDDGFVTVAADGTIAEVGSRRPLSVQFPQTGPILA